MLQDDPWLYAGVNTVHVLGIALLVGAIVVLDLRLLGAWRAVPVAALAWPATTVAGTGLALALVTGAALFTVQAEDYAANPFLYVKFGAILLGLVNLAALRWAGGWRDGKRPVYAALAGGLSLLSWLVALVAGRLMAYW